MSGKSKNLFLDTLVPVIAGLCALGLAMYWAYAYVSEISREQHAGPSTVQEREVGARIKPIGRVVVAGEEIEASQDAVAAGAAGAPETPAAEAPVRVLDGRAVYAAACTVCHGMGIAGAPKTGDQDAWAPRLEQGMDTLVKHAIDGFQGSAGYMPPRGGHANLTDEQVRDAVQHMVDALD